MNEVETARLQVDPFPGGICANQHAKWLTLWVFIESKLYLLPPFNACGTCKRADALVNAIGVRESRLELAFQPAAGVLVLCKDNEPAFIPDTAGSHVRSHPIQKPTNPRVWSRSMLAS